MLIDLIEIEPRLVVAGDFIHEVFHGHRVLLIGSMGDPLLQTSPERSD